MLTRYNLLACDLIAMMSFAIGYKLNGLQPLYLNINYNYILSTQSFIGSILILIGVLWFFYRELKFNF